MKQIKIELDKIKIRENNPNKMNTKQLSALENSIKKFGQLRPLLIDQDNNLIDGHQLMEALKNLKYKEAGALQLNLKKKSDKILLSQIMNKVRGKHSEELDAEDFKEILKGLDMESFSDMIATSEQEILNIINKTDEETKELMDKAKQEIEVSMERKIECPHCKGKIIIQKKGEVKKG